MTLRILILIVFICANTVYANVAAINETDYFLKYIPTGQTIQVGKALSFALDKVKVYLEHRNDTGEDYVGAITVYGSDYETSRGIRVGDTVEKVKELYGEPNRYSGSRSHYKWISYMEESQVLKVHFYLDKETEQVIAMHLSIYPVGTPMMIIMDDGQYH